MKIDSLNNVSNVENLHMTIINHLSDEREAIAIEKRLTHIQEQMLENITYIDYMALEKERTKLETSLIEIKNKDKLKRYLDDTSALVSKILKLTYVDNTMLELFLYKASKYIKLDIVHNKSDLLCDFCNSEKVDNVSSGISECKNCKTSEIMLIKNPCQQHHQKLDDEEDNFVKALARYQGKQKSPDQTHVSRVKEYLLSYRLIDDQDKPQNKTKEAKKLLYNAMKQLGYESEYKDANLYGHLIWGWQLPDISNHEERVLKLFRETQKYYNLVKGRRKFGLNNDMRLLLTLKFLNIPYNTLDFKIADTTDVLKYNIDTFNKMLMLAGYEPISYEIP